MKITNILQTGLNVLNVEIYGALKIWHLLLASHALAFAIGVLLEHGLLHS